MVSRGLEAPLFVASAANVGRTYFFLYSSRHITINVDVSLCPWHCRHRHRNCWELVFSFCSPDKVLTCHLHIFSLPCVPSLLSACCLPLRDADHLQHGSRKQSLRMVAELSTRLIDGSHTRAATAVHCRDRGSSATVVCSRGMGHTRCVPREQMSRFLSPHRCMDVTVNCTCWSRVQICYRWIHAVPCESARACHSDFLRFRVSLPFSSGASPSLSCFQAAVRCTSVLLHIAQVHPPPRVSPWTEEHANNALLHLLDWGSRS